MGGHSDLEVVWGVGGAESGGCVGVVGGVELRVWWLILHPGWPSVVVVLKHGALK